MKVAGRYIVPGEMNSGSMLITKRGAVLEGQGLNPGESGPRDTLACGSGPMLVASKRIQLHPSTAENFLGNVKERMKSKQKPGQALGTYWTPSSRNQLILTSLILIFHHKEGGNSFKLLLCIIII